MILSLWCSPGFLTPNSELLLFYNTVCLLYKWGISKANCHALCDLTLKSNADSICDCKPSKRENKWVQPIHFISEKQRPTEITQGPLSVQVWSQTSGVIHSCFHYRLPRPSAKQDWTPWKAGLCLQVHIVTRNFLNRSLFSASPSSF